MIYDIILILIFLVFIIVYAIRGASKSLARIIASVLSYLAATYLGRILSVIIYDGILKKVMINTVTNALQNTGANAIDTIGQSMPSWLSGLLSAAGVDISAIVDEKLAAAGNTAGEAISDAIRPAIIDVLTFILTIIMFMFIYLVLSRLLIKPLMGVFKLPGVRTVDVILGGAIGFINALLVVSLLAYLLKLFLPYIGSASGIFNESTVFNSRIFYHFYNGNIFTWLVSWIG